MLLWIYHVPKNIQNIPKFTRSHFYDVDDAALDGGDADANAAAI